MEQYELSKRNETEESLLEGGWNKRERLLLRGRKLLDCGVRIVHTILMTVLLIILLYKVPLLECSRAEHNEAKQKVTLTYGSDPRYMSLDHKYDLLWDNVSGSKDAVILLPDAMLSSDFSELDENAQGMARCGSISMIHQLHCLARLREALQRSQAGEAIEDDLHWPHCFNYLRNSILCFADDTIERPRYSNGTIGALSIQGSFDPRQCGDSNRLFALRSEHGGESFELSPSL